MTDSTPVSTEPPVITGSRVAATIQINSAFIVLTAIVISLRVFARAYLSRFFGADDYLICLGAVFAFGQGIVVIIGTDYGLGLHAYEIHDFPSKQIPFLKVIFASSLIYTFAMMFTKFSILVFYLRLQPKPSFRYSVYAVIFFVFGVSVGSMFAIVFQCSPIAFAWDLSINGTCMHRNAYYYANSALNIFSDFAIYFLAIPLVKTVQLPRRQKRGLYLVLGLGCFVCVSGIIRMYTLHTVNHTVDSTWALIDPFNWSTIEANIGILCACIPSFKVIITRYWPKYLGKLTSSHESHHDAVDSGNGTGVIITSNSNKSGNKRDNFSPDASNYQATIQMGKYNKVDDPQNQMETGSVSAENQYNSSEEHIIKNGENNNHNQHINNTSIYKRTDVHVAVHTLSGEALARTDSESDFERRDARPAV